jgi:hypothetical protein
MRTQIDKRFDWGFFLSEQELRRLVNLMQSLMDKASPGSVKRTFEVQLRDGSIIETGEVDEVTRLDNYGSKGIYSLQVTLAGDCEGAPVITFRLREPAFYRWFRDESVAYSITGSSNDWAVLAAGAIEERLRKVRKVSWRRVFSRENFRNAWVVAFTLSAVFAGLSVSKPPPQRVNVAAALEQLRSEGKIRDGVDAIIQLERLKAAEVPDWALFFGIFVGFTASCLVPVLALRSLMVGLLPSYAFYWGDNIGVLDRKRNWARLVFGVIILGVVVSVVGNWLYEGLARH